jgi:hypothetical protein
MIGALSANVIMVRLHRDVLERGDTMKNISYPTAPPTWPEITGMGDAVEPRDATYAMVEGARAGLSI